MDYVQSILKRYPNLTESDFSFIDRYDGKGIVFEYWNSDDPQPTMEQVKQWNDEDLIDFIPPVDQYEVLKKQLTDMSFELMIKGVL